MKINGYALLQAAAALCAALVLTGCSLLKVAVATGDPLSKEQMNVRTMTRGFYYDMAGEVARAADSIVAASPDVNVRVAAVRWKIRATRSIRKMTNPDRKKAGMIVSRSTTPSYDMRNFPIAFPLVHVGYRKSAVHMRRMYSTQNMPVVTHSITLSSP